MKKYKYKIGDKVEYLTAFDVKKDEDGSICTAT